MYGFLCSELGKLNIELVSALRLDECTVKRPYLLNRFGIADGSVIIFAVPYLTEVSAGERNISSYAVSRDYHLFFASLKDELLCKLRERYPNNKFAIFSDHSPIDEIEASARAGLGVIGKNHLLITEKYSSYVFIGEIVTDAFLPSFAREAEHCENCGQCLRACPVNTDISLCLSSLTQKKGELTKRESELIKASGCAWGCDICQEVCPHTKKALRNGTIYTDINFFKHSTTSVLRCEDIESMNETEFSERAYSWRGKRTIIRNLKILEKS